MKLQIDLQKELVANRKEKRWKFTAENKYIPELIPESVTRKIFIDLLLKEAGWDNLREGRELEFEVMGMPHTLNSTGKGFADYVLWGYDGLPHAVVEAKKTMADAYKGKRQAELYANCLEKNFEYFQEFPQGTTPTNPRPLSQRIFETKLEVALELRANTEPTAEDLEAAKNYIDQLHQQIAKLDHDRIVVRKELRLVNQFTLRERWENIGRGDFADICNHLSGLLAVADNDDEAAKRFDLIVLNLQLALLFKSNKQNNLIGKIGTIGMLLTKKKTSLLSIGKLRPSKLFRQMNSGKRYQSNGWKRSGWTCET